MCLTIPRKIISKERSKILVNVNGRKSKVDCRLLDVKVGDYVTIQNGFAVRKINKKEAQEILKLLK